MAKKTSKYPIESFANDWAKNPKDRLPQSGEQVRQFLGKQKLLLDEALKELRDHNTDTDKKIVGIADTLNEAVEKLNAIDERLGNIEGFLNGKTFITE